MTWNYSKYFTQHLSYESELTYESEDSLLLCSSLNFESSDLKRNRDDLSILKRMI